MQPTLDDALATPPRASARHTDRATSHGAARSVEALPAKRLAVLRAVDRATFPPHGWPPEPATDEQIAAAYAELVFDRGYPRQSPSGLRTRRAELVAAGLVDHADDDGTTAAGRRCARWVPTEIGVRLARTARAVVGTPPRGEPA